MWGLERDREAEKGEWRVHTIHCALELQPIVVSRFSIASLSLKFACSLAGQTKWESRRKGENQRKRALSELGAFALRERYERVGRWGRVICCPFSYSCNPRWTVVDRWCDVRRSAMIGLWLSHISHVLSMSLTDERTSGIQSRSRSIRARWFLAASDWWESEGMGEGDISLILHLNPIWTVLGDVICRDRCEKSVPSLVFAGYLAIFERVIEQEERGGFDQEESPRTRRFRASSDLWESEGLGERDLLFFYFCNPIWTVVDDVMVMCRDRPWIVSYSLTLPCSLAVSERRGSMQR